MWAETMEDEADGYGEVGYRLVPIMNSHGNVRRPCLGTGPRDSGVWNRVAGMEYPQVIVVLSAFSFVSSFS